METKYKILAAVERELLEGIVSGHIRTGRWKPVGAPFYISEGIMSKNKHYQFWFQAVSKMEKNIVMESKQKIEEELARTEELIDKGREELIMLEENLKSGNISKSKHQDTLYRISFLKAELHKLIGFRNALQWTLR